MVVAGKDRSRKCLSSRKKNSNTCPKRNCGRCIIALSPISSAAISRRRIARSHRSRWQISKRFSAGNRCFGLARHAFRGAHKRASASGAGSLFLFFIKELKTRCPKPVRFFSDNVRPVQFALRKKGKGSSALWVMVRAKGFEPPRVASTDPKSAASTSSATPAHGI